MLKRSGGSGASLLVWRRLFRCRWKCERNINSAGFGFWIFAATRGNDHELTAFDHVGCVRGVSGKRNGGFSEQFARGFVERTKFLVVVRRANKDDTTGRDNRSTIIFRTCVRQTLRREFGIKAKRNFPYVFPRVEVDGVECAPGWSNGRISFGIEKFLIAREAVFHSRRWRPGACQLFAFAAHQILDEGEHLVFGKIRKEIGRASCRER